MQLIVSSTMPNRYIVSGDIAALLKNRRAKMLLYSNLAYKEIEGHLEIDSEESIERIVNLINL